MLTDYQIVVALKTGEKDALEDLFRLYYNSLCGYAFTFMKEQAASEEIVQDLFCKLWEKRAMLEVTSLKSYLFRAVRNACMNQLKHIEVRELHKIETNVDDIDSVTPEILIESGEVEARIQKAITELPVERQKIFRMSRFEEMKYKEIAEELNLSVKTVENQMGKALKSLRIELADIYPALIATLITFYIEFIK